ncbi:uncharacterized protein EV422DRAFT_618076 [Fimicolochytrium jonesii]|uniref:uncharacterized protein n=1 Tax=Fimicolochytrium jonesii TaxID=1396493 RepID=UPI0022FDFF91|nr:uncharacterized protein EV422DRAFT_618076 [Fimicolochytrium jonesii]KAI8824405.1 hypothetical protein EV422DRAFT_618076 [Fimicolochytrium jonesii]
MGVHKAAPVLLVCFLLCLSSVAAITAKPATSTKAVTPTPTTAAITFVEPTSEAEIIKIVSDAYNARSLVRVVGSNHSWADVVIDNTPAKKRVLISLENYSGVTVDKKTNIAVVKAGTHIGDHAHSAKGVAVDRKVTLIHELEKYGYGLPVLAGIQHQSVGGFLSTGAAGGSVKRSLLDAVVKIALIDGCGKKQVYAPPQKEFYAAGVSLGLLGVVTEVHLRLDYKLYNISGSEVACPVTPLSQNNSLGSPIDFFGPGKTGYPSLLQFFTGNTNDGARVQWYPQKLFNRIQIYQWKQAALPAKTPLSPFVIFGGATGADAVAIQEQVAGGLQFLNAANDESPEFYEQAAGILDQFVPFERQTFYDVYYNSVSPDNGISDTILPVVISEFWFPLEKLPNILATLKTYYAKNGYNATGATSVEIYTGKKSLFYLGPSYNTDVVRLNYVWPSVNTIGTPQAWFQQFWDLLKPFEPRFHWGKVLPSYYKGAYLTKSYPKLADFLKVRQDLDPRQVFVTNYWRNILGIPAATVGKRDLGDDQGAVREPDAFGVGQEGVYPDLQDSPILNKEAQENTEYRDGDLNEAVVA